MEEDVSALKEALLAARRDRARLQQLAMGYGTPPTRTEPLQHAATPISAPDFDDESARRLLDLTLLTEYLIDGGT